VEVDRYIVWPAQACAYKIGQLKILELRNKAMHALKDKFDLREFHNTLLSSAALPLPTLEKAVNKWIDSKRSHN